MDTGAGGDASIAIALAIAEALAGNLIPPVGRLFMITIVTGIGVAGLLAPT